MGVYLGRSRCVLFNLVRGFHFMSQNGKTLIKSLRHFPEIIIPSMDIQYFIDLY